GLRVGAVDRPGGGVGGGVPSGEQVRVGGVGGHVAGHHQAPVQRRQGGQASGDGGAGPAVVALVGHERLDVADLHLGQVGVAQVVAHPGVEDAQVAAVGGPGVFRAQTGQPFGGGGGQVAPVQAEPGQGRVGGGGLVCRGGDRGRGENVVRHTPIFA